MIDRQFSGFGDVSIAASTFGDPDDPPLLILPDIGQSRGEWTELARALAAAGRYAVSIDLRGAGESEQPGDRRYDLDAHIRDLSAILAQFSSRPVIVGMGLGGWIALAALGDGEPDLATGLAMIGADSVGRGEASKPGGTGIDFDTARPRLIAAAKRIRQPALLVEADGNPNESSDLENVMADAEKAFVSGPERPGSAEYSEALGAQLIEFLERRVPRDPPEYYQGSDSRTLRDALGCFATGVTVVTTVDEDGAPVGLTANSFTSVSLEPELLLVSLAKSATSLPAFQAAERFAVNVLHIGQQPVSNRFAKQGADKFADTDVEIWEGGVPILKGSLASFECDKFAMHDGGDHELLIGRVRRVRYEPQRDPLLYFRGKYRRLHFA